MTREEKSNLLNELLEYEENNDIGNLTRAERQEFQQWISKALEHDPKTGHWIWTLEDWNKWECSECGFTKRTDTHVDIGYQYCPKCGCYMESEVGQPSRNLRHQLLERQ